jgi:hypothetical protein
MGAGGSVCPAGRRGYPETDSGGREGRISTAAKQAARIAEAMGENGGLVTLDDLSGYRPVKRKVLHGTYRGLEILTMLKMLKPDDLGAMGF